MDGLTTPAVVLNTQQFIQPLLEAQQRQIGLQEQRVKNIGLGIADVRDKLNKIKIQGSIDDQATFLNAQKMLEDNWTKDIVAYGGPEMLPAEKRAKYNTLMRELEANAYQAKQDEAWYDETYKWALKEKASGNLQNEEELFNSLAEFRSAPIGQRVPPDLTKYVVPKSVSLTKPVSLFGKPARIKSDTGVAFNFDKKKFDEEFALLRDTDPEFQKSYRTAMANGMSDEGYRDFLFNNWKGQFQTTTDLTTDEERGKKAIEYDYTVVKPGEVKVGAGETEVPVDFKGGYSNMPISLRNVPFEDKQVDVLNVRVLPNNKVKVLIKYTDKSTSLSKEVSEWVNYEDIKSGMKNVGKVNKAWTELNETQIQDLMKQMNSLGKETTTTTKPTTIINNSVVPKVTEGSPL